MRKLVALLALTFCASAPAEADLITYRITGLISPPAPWDLGTGYQIGDQITALVTFDTAYDADVSPDVALYGVVATSVTVGSGSDVRFQLSLSEPDMLNHYVRFTENVFTGDYIDVHFGSLDAVAPSPLIPGAYTMVDWFFWLRNAEGTAFDLSDPLFYQVGLADFPQNEWRESRAFPFVEGPITSIAVEAVSPPTPPPAPVPEPASLLLLGTGLAVAGLVRRRRP